jgi:two-component system LytT family sensor kinase
MVTVGSGFRPGRVLALAVLAAGLLSLDVLRALPAPPLGRAVLLGFANALVKVLLWAPAAVVIFRLCRRFPLDRRPRAISVAVHVASWLLLSTAVALLSHPLQGLIRPALLTVLPAEGLRRMSASWTGTFDRRPWFTLVMALPWDQLTYWPIFAAATYAHGAAEARRREQRRVELERALSGARLAVLETQLQPHFLFNALHTISALVASQPAEARAVTRRLRDLFARLLGAHQALVQPLADELQFLDDYLAIQKARFGDRLILEVDAPAECLALSVPCLLLQPLVENAIRHAAARRAGPTRIAVRAWRQADRLELEVHDDGPGSSGRTSGTGVGLSNTRLRLDQLYGSDHQFQFEGSAPPWGGVRVRIGVPMRPPPTVPAPARSQRKPRPWLAPWLLFAAVMGLQNLGTCAALAPFAGAPGVSFGRTFLASTCGATALVLLFPIVYAVNHFIFNKARGRGVAARVLLHVPGPPLLCLAKATLVRLLATAVGMTPLPPILWMAMTRFYADILHYLLMVGICHAVDRLRDRQEQELRTACLLAELASARLEAMRLRLDPDQLFATLEELEVLIERAPDDADRLVARLGEHLRHLLRERPVAGEGARA